MFKITLHCSSCCIDYIAAAHINADAIIHFGPVCFSTNLGNIPHLNIFEKHNLQIGKLKHDLHELINSNEVVIVADTDYFHKFGIKLIYIYFLFYC